MKSTVHNEHRDQIPNNKNDLINLEIKADNQIWRKKPRQGITIQCTEKKIIKETMMSYQQCSGSFTAEWKMDPSKTGTTVCKAEICISI